jgi:hypothetical protein
VIRLAYCSPGMHIYIYVCLSLSLCVCVREREGDTLTIVLSVTTLGKLPDEMCLHCNRTVFVRLASAIPLRKPGGLVEMLRLVYFLSFSGVFSRVTGRGG